MSARILAAAIGGLLFLLHARFAIHASGLTVTVYVPWVLLAAFLVALSAGAWIIWRNVHGFRSSPYPRVRTAT